MYIALLKTVYIHLCGHPLFPVPPVRLLRRERRVDIAPLDVLEHDTRRLFNLLDDLRVALSRIARSRVSTVKPVHEAALVPPDAHCEDHAPAHGTTHALHSTQAHEVACAILGAVRIVHGYVGGDVLDDFAVLDVLADNGLEGAVGSGELRDDSEGLGSIYFAAGLVVVLIGCVGVLAAAVLVAETGLGALVAGATENPVLRTDVGCNLGRGPVCLPNVELVAADALACNITLHRVSTVLQSSIRTAKLTTPFNQGVT
jgi:hypothetical protein